MSVKCLWKLCTMPDHGEGSDNSFAQVALNSDLDFCSVSFGE